jgi:CDP-paratose 2-epimerase
MSGRILVTGGAGFVGANLSVALATRDPGRDVIAFDNLKRRGSELNLPRLRGAGVRFVHGDVRSPSDLEAAGPIDALVECSAEPSVMAGVDGGTDFVVHTNLIGAYNCLELARRHDAAFVFLSTSRVYPTGPLNELRYEEGESRFELADDQPYPGASSHGIAEEFPLGGHRTLYGATKLGAELLIHEYVEAFDLDAVINRCGVIAGPWQMGKVDQGVFTHWMVSHQLGRELAYIGYGGQGKQVRDMLHPDDLVDLIERQLASPAEWSGATLNVGGGPGCSLSLREATDICAELTGRTVPIRSEPENRAGDIPIYVSDCARLFGRSDWRPARGARQIMDDIFEWVRDHEGALRTALA